MSPSSDYPGVFDKYPMETFLEIYRQLEANQDLSLPQSMRGRDLRIISDEVLVPVAIGGVEEKDFEDRGRRGRRRKGRRGRRKEMKGFFYEDEAIEQNGHLHYEEYGRQDYRHNEYYEEYPEEYHYEEDNRGRGRGRKGGRRRGGGRRRTDYDDREVERADSQSGSDEESGRRGRRSRGKPRRSARQYNSRRRPVEDSDENQGKGGRNGRKSKKERTKPKKQVWAPKGQGVRKSASGSSASSGSDSAGGGRGAKEQKWVPKKYATETGVYQAKSPVNQ